jgi:GNAT superfamily N-acetyltransferase
MPEIQIVEYQKEDRLQCIDLLKKTFPGNSDEKTFTWRFESNNKLKPLIVCAKDGDKVVSFNSWLVWDFKYNNETYIGYQSGESATDPNYRGKGIWSKVLKYADGIASERKIDFLFGFPSTMSYNAFYKAGYCPIGLFNFYIRLFNPFKKLHKNIMEHNSFKFAENLLFEKNKIVPMVDNEYIEWRYIENPKTYNILKYEENGNKAFFVVRIRHYYNKKYKFGWNEGFLLDCQFSSLNELFIKKAFKYIDSIYAGKIFNIRTFFNPNTAKGRAIQKHFSIRLNSSYEILCIKMINKKIDYNLLFDFNNWDIMPHVIDEA